MPLLVDGDDKIGYRTGDASRVDIRRLIAFHRRGQSISRVKRALLWNATMFFTNLGLTVYWLTVADDTHELWRYGFAIADILMTVICLGEYLQCRRLAHYIKRSVFIAWSDLCHLDGEYRRATDGLDIPSLMDVLEGQHSTARQRDAEAIIDAHVVDIQPALEILADTHMGDDDKRKLENELERRRDETVQRVLRVMVRSYFEPCNDESAEAAAEQEMLNEHERLMAGQRAQAWIDGHPLP